MCFNKHYGAEDVQYSVLGILAVNCQSEKSRKLCLVYCNLAFGCKHNWEIQFIKNARCATRIHNKVSETFSDRKIYLKHELSTASLQSSTGKVILNIKLFYGYSYKDSGLQLQLHACVMLLWVYTHTGQAWKICLAKVGFEPRNPTVTRHIFQACPVWVYTQSNITQASYSPEYITPTQQISWLLDYNNDIEGTRLSSEISHTRTDLTA
jgi:hypothetical protein